MEIDYDLVEKIGATHYIEKRFGEGYILINADSLPSDCCGYMTVGSDCYLSVNELGAEVKLDGYSVTWGFLFNSAKPIPPKPQVRFEYEKVKLSNVGEFVQEVHDDYGKYYFLNKCSGEYQVAEFQDAAYYWKDDNVYRRVEKQVAWNQLVVDYKDNHMGGVYINKYFPKELKIEGIYGKEEAVNLAKAILRATGELK